MADVAERLRAFLVDAPHWVDLLAAVPAANVQRFDTGHPVFHGCIDWHSACHGVWSLLAHRGMTGSERYAGLVDSLLEPEALAREAAELMERPEFEMPYGRAWFLRLALEDSRVTRSTRLSAMAGEIADSLVRFYRENTPDPFAREYRSASWALTNLLDYARAQESAAIEAFVRDAAKRMAAKLDRAPSVEDEESWPDFMAVMPNFAELLQRAGALDPAAILGVFGQRLYGLKPVAHPQRAHHYALNFSRAWSLFALYEATLDERLLEGYLDHMECTLLRPSWWRGDYREVAHWVPQFGIFALQRALQQQR